MGGIDVKRAYILYVDYLAPRGKHGGYYGGYDAGTVHVYAVGLRDVLVLAAGSEILAQLCSHYPLGEYCQQHYHYHGTHRHLADHGEPALSCGLIREYGEYRNGDRRIQRKLEIAEAGLAGL